MTDKNSTPHAEPLTDFMSEFARVDERYSGQEYRHAFLMSMDMSRPYDFERAGPPTFQLMNMLSHLDVFTGKFNAASEAVVQSVIAEVEDQGLEARAFVEALVR